MKTSLQRILTKDSIELVGLLYEPEVKTSKTLVHVHGMAGNFYENLFLDSMAKTLTDHGVAFFAFNNRGCEVIKDLIKIDDGKRHIVRIGDLYEVFEDSVVDIGSAIDFVSAQGYSEIHLSGHSLGAPKVAYYAAEGNDKRLASVIFLSPSDMIGLMKAEKNYEKGLALAHNMVAEGRGGEPLPFPILWDGSSLSAQTYISLADPASKVAIFNFHDPKDSFHTLTKISIPIFAVMGRKDDALVIGIEDTMKKIEGVAISSPKVKTEILGDANHGYDGYEQKLADAILGWVRAVK